MPLNKGHILSLLDLDFPFVPKQNPLKHTAKRSINVVSPMQENAIMVSIGGKKTSGLIDTGAQISIASLDFLKKTDIKTSSLKPADINEIVGVGNEHPDKNVHTVLLILKI